MAFKNRGNDMDAIFTTNQYKVLETMYENTLTIADEDTALLVREKLLKNLAYQEQL